MKDRFELKRQQVFDSNTLAIIVRCIALATVDARLNLLVIDYRLQRDI